MLSSSLPLGRSVLVVDDEPYFRNATCRLLSSSGWATWVASNGWEAIDLLKQGCRPSVILLDHDMPGMNGSECLDAIRANPVLASMPVVCMSGHAWPRAEAFFLLKPFEPATLVDMLVLASHS